MKAQPFSALLVGAAVCVVSAGIGLVTSFAAEPPTTTKGGQPRQTTAESKGVTGSAPDNVLEIDGGVIGPAGTIKHGGYEATLKNVVEALRDRYTEANIVMAPGLDNLKIADLKLRTRNIWEDLEAVRIASGAKIEWQGPGSPVFSEHPDISPGAYIRAAAAQVNPATGLVENQPLQDNSGLFILRPATASPENERKLEAFNIDPYIEWICARQMSSLERFPSGTDAKAAGQKIRDEASQRALMEVREMVEQSINDLDPNHPEGEIPKFQFHSGANVLVVVGTRSALDVARKLIVALPGQQGIPGQNSMVNRPGADGLPDNAQEAFRRRYGLAPAGATPGEVPPGKPPQQPGQPK